MFNPIIKRKKWFNLAMSMILVFSMMFPASLSIGNVKHASAAVANHVLISQVFPGATKGTYKNKYIELYNPTAAAVSLTGWSIQVASSAGTTYTAYPLSGSIPANGYFLISGATTASTTNIDLPTYDQSNTSISPAQANAKIALVSSTVAITTGSSSATVVDFIGYGTANDSLGSAASSEASTTTLAITRKTNSGASPEYSGDGNGWDSRNNKNDFALVTANPRNAAYPTATGTTNLNAVSIQSLLIYDAAGLPSNLGKSATITGVATVDDKLLGTDKTSFYLQDATGGINIFSASASSITVKKGNNYQVTGRLMFTKGQARFLASGITDLGEGSLPTAQSINITDLSSFATIEPLEGKLVKFFGKVTSTSALVPDSSITVTDAAYNAATVKILGTTGLDVTQIVDKDSSYTFTGIIGQSKDYGPYTSGYYLMPRSLADIRGDLTLTHSPLLKVISGVNLPFSAISKNADSVTLYYKAKGEGAYRAPITMYSADNLNYNGTISSNLVPLGGLIYEIVAQGNGKSLKAGPFTVEEGDDTEGPVFKDESPAKGAVIETKHPVISVSMSDLSGVNTSSAKIKMDSIDFTKNAIITDNQIKLTLTSDLSEGIHTVDVEAKDTLNNLSSYSWTFTVAKRFVGGQHYRGSTHNHTNISHDAVGTPETALTEAMKYDYDWFAFSDHSHDIDPCPTDPISKKIVCTDTVDHGGMPERTGGSDWQKTKDLASTYNKNNPGKFVVFPAFEMTSTTWGHSNVFGTDDFIDRMQDGGKYQTLQNYYAWTMTYDNIVAQFNHPNAPANSFDNFIPYNKTLDKLFTMLEVGNGSGQYSYSNTQDKYFTALDIGWHVAPTYGEDNHDGTWGQTKKRTVIVTDKLNQQSLLDSMRDMHVYMSEDPNAKLDVMASGWYMGSITDTKTLQFDINVSDPVLEDKSNPKYGYLLPSITQNDNISKIELITNGGRVVDSIDLSSANTTSYNWKPNSITVSGGQQWFVVRTTQKDNDKIFSAPIWTPSDPLNIKVTSVTAEGGAITGAVPVKLTAAISNLGVVNVTNLKASFYVDEPSLGNKIGDVVIDSLPLNKSATAEVIWANPIQGPHDITVVLTAGDGNDLGPNKFNQAFMIKPSLGIKIVIDASHQNENSSKDTGTYVNNLQSFTTMMRKEGYTVEENTGATLTSAALAGARILMLTHPASSYSTSEIDAVKTFVDNGGSIYLSEKSNSQTLNNLLSGVGSSILFNNDTIYDDSRAGNFWSTILANEFAVKAHPVPMDNYLTDFVSSFDFYRGTSLAKNNGAGGKAALTEIGNVSIPVRGNETTYQLSAPTGGVSYKVGSGATGGSKIPLVAAEKIGSGRLIVAGMNFLNDIQLDQTKNNNDNTEFALNSINWLAHLEPKVISIGEARQKAIDTPVVVQGKVTSAAGGFYDAVYVQDDTGGIMAFNEVPPGTLKLGDTIRIYGHIKVFEDNFELEFDKFANSIVKISSGSPVQPYSVSTAASVSDAYLGQLVKVFGTVVKIPDASSYVINDGSGDVLVFVDGYIMSQSGVPAPQLALGDKLAAIGLSGKFSGGTRIRVRDTAELKKTDKLNPVTGVNLSTNSITLSPGDPTVTLTASVLPANATYTSIVWTSNNEAVAKVNNGIVTPIGLGTAVITAESLDGGIKAAATVYVIPTAPNVRADLTSSSIVSNDSSVLLSALPAMEYSLDGSDWLSFVIGSPPTFTGLHNVQIRFKASGDVLPGLAKNLFFNTPAPDLTGATLAVGTVLGAKLTSVPAGNLKYVVGSANAWYRPAIGELATDYSKQLKVNQDIYVTANQHIFIASVDGNNKIIGWLDLTADSTKIAAPSLVAKWDFEAKTEFASDGTLANKAIKAVTLTGAVLTAPASGSGGTGTSAIASSGWIPTPSYWQASFDTTGYSYIQVSSKMYSSSSGPKEFKLQYSLNGSIWLDVPNSSMVVANAAWTNVLSNVTLPAQANNLSNVYIRWLNTSTVSTSNGTTGSGGTNRLDDVVINGIPLSLAPNVSADNVNKTITGIDATMEYNIGNTGWITYNVSSPPNLNGNYSVQVRSSAKGDVLPGQIKTVIFTQQAAELAAAITAIADPQQDAVSLTLPTVPAGFTIAIKSSSNTAVIKTDGTIIPSSSAATVTLVLEVTRTSDSTKASTGNLTVVVPAKTVTASDIAGAITSITAPQQDAVSLLLPTVPAGFTVAIKSSNNTAVIKTDGTIIPSSSTATVTLVLEVTRTSDSTKASTGNLTVVVPAKSMSSIVATLTGDDHVIAGSSFDLTFGLSNVTSNVYGQDITITYDPTQVEFTSAVSLRDGYQVVDTSNKQGQIRFIAVSFADAKAPNGNLLLLHWKAKSTITQLTNSTITITDLVVADGRGVESLVTGASHDIQINAKVIVDKAVLSALIGEVQSIYDGAVEGTKIDQYPATSKANLLTAINSAKSISNNQTAAQQDVDQAVTALNSALQTFKASIIKPGFGDLNRDGKISIGDLAIVVSNYGKTSADPNWDLYKIADVNNDGKVDLIDLATVAREIIQIK